VPCPFGIATCTVVPRSITTRVGKPAPPARLVQPLRPCRLSTHIPPLIPDVADQKPTELRKCHSDGHPLHATLLQREYGAESHASTLRAGGHRATVSYRCARLGNKDHDFCWSVVLWFSCWGKFLPMKSIGLKDTIGVRAPVTIELSSSPKGHLTL